MAATVDFTTAWTAFLTGSRVKRQGWDNNQISYIFYFTKFNLSVVMGVIKRANATDGLSFYNLTNEDILTADWVIMP